MMLLESTCPAQFAVLFDSPSIFNPPVLLILFGGGLVVVAVIGGGLKAKQIEIPTVSRLNRVIAGVLGLCLLGAGLFLALNPTGYLPSSQAHPVPAAHSGTEDLRPQRPPAHASELMPIACSELANLRSGDDVRSTHVVFRNEKSSPVSLFWVNHQGQPKLWNTIPSGEMIDAPTHPTHVWLVMNNQGQCLDLFRAGPGDAVASIR
jgi:hypothetical protein